MVSVSLTELASKFLTLSESHTDTPEAESKPSNEVPHGFDDGGAIGQGSGDFRIKTGTSGGYTTWTVNNGQINIWTDVHLGRAGRQSWNNAGDISLPHGWKNSYMQFYGTTGGNWDGNDRTAFRVSNISGASYGGVSNGNNIGQINVHSNRALVIGVAMVQVRLGSADMLETSKTKTSATSRDRPTTQVSI